MQGTVLIPQDEIRFNPASYADPAGSVFRWRDGLYRGISKLYEPRLRKLLEDRVLTDLAALGFFAGAEPTDLATKDFSFVLKLKAIDFVSYCPEWCPDMLKDAALMVLDLECELTRR